MVAMNFTRKDITDIWGDWINKNDIFPVNDSDVLYVDEASPAYEGYALAIFVFDGKLYEVNDSHCSCSGFENYGPELTTKEALLKREFGSYCAGTKDDIAAALANYNP